MTKNQIKVKIKKLEKNIESAKHKILEFEEEKRQLESELYDIELADLNEFIGNKKIKPDLAMRVLKRMVETDNKEIIDE